MMAVLPPTMPNIYDVESRILKRKIIAAPLIL